MLLSWFNAKQVEMERVLKLAQRLRSRYGDRAAEVCDTKLTTVERSRRGKLRQIKRVLKHLPPR